MPRLPCDPGCRDPSCRSARCLSRNYPEKPPWCTCEYVTSGIQCGDESKGQAPRLAAWNCEITAILLRRSIGGWLLAAIAAARPHAFMPQSRPMPAIGSHCHELRIADSNKIWRIVYRIDRDAIVIAEVFQKKTTATPKSIIDVCSLRFRMYDDEN